MAPSEDRSGDPNVALLLTWLVPGVGHLYLGRGLMALWAFLLIEGLYGVGWLLSEGRSFEFLDPELRGLFATVLTPEVGNLGGMIAQMKLVGFGERLPSPFADHVELGGMLTGLSGLLNGFLMVHVHNEARRPASVSGLHPASAVALAWAFPGLGHWAQGRRLRALIVCVMLLGLFVWGTWLSEGSNLSRQRHFYYWSGQFLLGAPALVSEILSGRPPVTGPMPRVDVGLLYACMAGLLNVIAMLDVHGVAEARWRGEAESSSRTEALEERPANP